MTSAQGEGHPSLSGTSKAYAVRKPSMGGCLKKEGGGLNCAEILYGPYAHATQQIDNGLQG